MTTNIEEGFREFLDRGYRPSLKSHMFGYDPEKAEEGWAIFYQPDYFDHDILNAQIMGWQVNAMSIRSGKPDILGGTFRTIAEALFYSLHELDKYAPKETA